MPLKHRDAQRALDCVAFLKERQCQGSGRLYQLPVPASRGAADHEALLALRSTTANANMRFSNDSLLPKT